MKRTKKRSTPPTTRDEFSEPVKRQLRERVNGRCSNPDCDAQTQGPGIRPGSVVRVGQAAHISGAAKGGPRYDERATREARTSIDNGIWLCNVCAKKVDADEEKFPPLLLLRWKETSEHRVSEQLGRPAPQPDEAIRQLSAALTGLPTTFLPRAIANTHGATEQVLTSLDPRLLVKTSYAGGVSTYEVVAIEDVNVSLHPPSDAAEQWRKASQSNMAMQSTFHWTVSP